MKRAGVILSTAVLSAVGLVGLAPSASADDSRCPANSFCLFQNTDFGGQRVVFNRTGYAYCNLSDYAFNNKASSMINNTGRRVILWQLSNCGGGESYPAEPHSVDSTFSNNNFNDKASAVVIP
jgi:hypothetical protein